MTRLVIVGWLACVLCAVAGAQSPAVEIKGLTPDPATRLAPQQSLYVRVAYAHSQPLRFQAAGYRDGQKRDQMMTNTAPVHPAGQGEAIVWLAGDAGARIDEIRVHVFDRAWTPLGEFPVTFAAEWHAAQPDAPTAPWAAAMIAAQATLPTVHENTSTSWLDNVITALLTVLVPFAFLSVPAYPAVQIVALMRLRGSIRLLSAAPVAFMLPVYAYCLFALTQGSNLWPLYAIFASPAALLLTGTVLIVGLRRQRHPVAPASDAALTRLV